MYILASAHICTNLFVSGKDLRKRKFFIYLDTKKERHFKISTTYLKKHLLCHQTRMSLLYSATANKF